MSCAKVCWYGIKQDCKSCWRKKLPHQCKIWKYECGKWCDANKWIFLGVISFFIGFGGFVTMLIGLVANNNLPVIWTGVSLMLITSVPWLIMWTVMCSCKKYKEYSLSFQESHELYENL